MNGMVLACDDDGGDGAQSSIIIDLLMGQEVTIVVDGYNADDVGDYVLNIEQAMCPIATDLDNMVLPIMGTLDPGPSTLSGSCGGNGPELVFSWTAPADGNFSFDTFGSAFDTVLHVYDADPCGVANELGCNDDAMGLQSEVSLGLTQGDQVFIVLDAFGANVGDYTLNITQN
jgi:hypothetical protein